MQSVATSHHASAERPHLDLKSPDQTNAQPSLRRNTTFFTFEERFKAFVGNKVIDNVSILQERRQKEYNHKVNQMLHSDLDQTFTNIEFRRNVDPSNPDNMLVDLTHAFIHRAIEVGN